MSQEIITPPKDIPYQRELAYLIGQSGSDQIYADAIAKHIPVREYMAKMLWEFVTEGRITFADGTYISCDDYGQWLQTVKFLTNHLDGPARSDVNVGVNVFKVYVGIDEDMV